MVRLSYFSRSPVATWKSVETLFGLGIIVHLPLVFALRSFALLSTLYALLILGGGLYFLWKDRQPSRVIYLTAYLVGAEVLWRMTHAGVFWEFGKYALVLILFLAILKWDVPLRAWPLLYFVPLLPSVVLTAGGFAFLAVREELSFNLSGALALMVAVWFFGRVRLTPFHIRNILLSITLPVTGIAFLALYTTLTAPEIIFGTVSNFTTSGGYGPNQVSAVLGLGALSCWVYFLMTNVKERLRWGVLGVGIWLFLQAVFTFSRGGIFNFLVAAPFATYYLLRGTLRARLVIFIGFAAFGAVLFFALPRLDSVTNGELAARYRDLETTGRLEIWQGDIKVWQENLWFGVGPGRAAVFRPEQDLRGAAPHTEYSRLLAEHGLLGLFSMGVLFWMAWMAWRNAVTPFAKGIALVFLLWALVEMSHSAMRVAAISYLFALSQAKITEEA